MKKRTTTVLLIALFLVGLCLLLYPTVSDWWNSRHQSKAIANYAETVNNLDTSEIENIMNKARDFNTRIKKADGFQYLTKELQAEYYELLDITGTGIMAYIEIPDINVSLPIYHGVSDSVLQVAVGHIEWSSLPVGGEDAHCVVSGHRGLPSAKLFTNLDKLTTGDVFMINVLNDTLTYEVDQILIVNPEEIGALNIVGGQDYCTLVTCTPYGINSHRLLIRGHRIANFEDAPVIHITAEAGIIDNIVVAPVIAAPILFGLLIYVMIKYRKKK